MLRRFFICTVLGTAISLLTRLFVWSLVFFVAYLYLTGCGGAEALHNSVNNDNHNRNTVSICGNGAKELGEECDDGDRNSDVAADACRSDCRFAFCGDSVIDSDEECDNQDLSGNVCQTFGYTRGALSCSPYACEYDFSSCSLCGNGVAEGQDNSQPHYEVCDGTDLRGQDCISIGQAQGELGCNLDCTWDISGCVGSGPVCGNGVVESGEECDDGNDDVTDACPDGPAGTCQNARCGDGYVWAGVEGCDDGNGINEDICPDGVGGTCQLAACGDGFVFIGAENCEPTLDPLCHANCTSFCGDGIEQPQFGELCDPGVDQECYADCSGSCGDGIVQTANGEECESTLGGAVCHDCKLPFCGDGYCDESPYTCPSDCQCAPGSLPNQPAVLCPTGGCLNYGDGAWGAFNCGLCGNNCGPMSICLSGMCSG